MIAAANLIGASAFGQVMQAFPSGRSLPIEYTTVRLGDGAGLVAVGKNLAAVASVQSGLRAAREAREQDYWTLREVETRYRLLFDASHEAVVMLAADDLSVRELNPAAVRAFGLAPGDRFAPLLAARDRDRVLAMLAQARVQGRLPACVIHLGDDEAAWLLRASLMPGEMSPERGGVLILQLGRTAAGQRGAGADAAALFDAFADRLPDAFVVIDTRGTVQRVNPAFLDLVQASAEGAVLGAPLGQWLRHPGADAGVMLDMIERHRVVRRLSTTIHGAFDERQVEVCAVGNSDTRPSQIGVLLRNVGPRAAPDAAASGPGETEPVGPLGATPMLKRVRDTTKAMERDYILAALRQAGGNRSAAAEMLGMSRQTLYMKLGRYGQDEDLPLPYGRSG